MKIKSKYSSSYNSINFKSKYDLKLNYYKNLIFYNKYIYKTFINNKYNKKFIINNGKYDTNKLQNNQNTLTYYDYFFKGFCKQKKNFLFNLSKPFVLSSYQVYI